MLLELAGDSSVDGPVPRIVRTHGELVDEDALVCTLPDDEHFDGEDAGDAQLGRNTLADATGLRSRLRSDSHGGGAHLGAHAVHLHGGGHGPRGDVTRRGARQQSSNLSGEGNQGFGQEGTIAPPRGHVRRTVGDGHAVPVVAAARGFDDERPTDRGAKLLQLRLILDACPRRARDPHLGQALTHGELVLRIQQGARRGLNGDETRGLLHSGCGNVLMLEGQDVRAVDERANRVQVGGSPNGLINRHLSG